VVIEGADEQSRRAILELLPERDAPTTLFEAERIAEEAATRARAWLRSEGYYAAEVTPEASEEPPSARLVIAPGARFRFAAPQLAFDDAAPDSETVAAAAKDLQRVAENAPARAQAVLEAEATALATLQAAGYPDAAAGARRVVVDHASNSVLTEFRFNAGARAKLGNVRVEPGGMFRDDFLRRLSGWKPGDQYDPERVSDLRRDLVSTGAVSRVTTRLAPADENGVRDVVLDVEAAKRHAYELGLGWSTTEGIGLEAEWTRRNFTGRADALTVALALGDMRQGASVALERPHAAGRARTQRFVAGYEREDNEAFTREGVQASASVDASPRLRLGTSYGVSVSANTFDAAAGVEEALVFAGFVDVHRDTTERPLDARSGTIVDLRLEPAVSTGDATVGFVRAMGDARIYHSTGREDRYTFAARTRVGWLETVTGDAENIPPDRRFYAGGGGSVRGYAYNSIFPEEREVLGLTPGGQGLFEIGLETRARLSDRWGAAAFVDGGAAFDTWEEAGDMRWGVGVGARYNLGFAPLRVDIAFPLDRRDGDSEYALYISLGQAF
jgi:translocation and assembly module TamA